MSSLLPQASCHGTGQVGEASTQRSACVEKWRT